MKKLNLIRAAESRVNAVSGARCRRGFDLVCGWTLDLARGKPVCAWRETDIPEVEYEPPIKIHDRGRPPSDLRVAA
jgi:hypothetical protein